MTIETSTHDCPVVSGGLVIHREDCPQVPPHTHDEAESRVRQRVLEAVAKLDHYYQGTKTPDWLYAPDVDRAIRGES